MISRRDPERVAEFLESTAIAFGEDVRDLCRAKIERYKEDEEFSPECVLREACNDHNEQIRDEVRGMSRVQFYSRL